MNEGVNAIGLNINTDTNFGQLTAGIQFEHIMSDLSFTDKKTAIKTEIPANAIINFDVIGRNLQQGSTKHELSEFLEVYQKHRYFEGIVEDYLNEIRLLTLAGRNASRLNIVGNAYKLTAKYLDGKEEDKT